MSGMVHETLRLMIRSKVLSSNIRVFAFITLKSQSRPNSLALALALFTIPIDRSTSIYLGVRLGGLAPMLCGYGLLIHFRHLG